MRLLYRCLARLTDPALADSVVGDLYEVRARRQRQSYLSARVWFWCAASALVAHAASVRLGEAIRGVRRGFRGSGDDLRDGARGIRRAPGFAIGAIVLVALGIGASTAIFSVAHGVAFRPLPYPQPERILRIYEANPASGKLREDVSEPAFHEWRTGSPSLESAAFFTDVRTRFLHGQQEQPIITMGVSPAFFHVLGVSPALGSGFRPEPEYTRATRSEVVISHGAWVRLFGRDPRVLDRRIRFEDDEDPHRIVGVMPESFSFESVDFWQPRLVQLPLGRISRNWRYERVIARLRPEATIDQARAELEAVAARLARDFPPQHGGWTVTVDTLHASVVGSFRRVSWMLLAAVAVVLAVTYLNVGGLLVARAVTRERDTAVRAALGAGRWRLARLRFCEALILGGGGAALGVLLAWMTVKALTAAAPPGIPRIEDVTVDLRTLAIAVLAALVAVMIFTLTPGGTRSTGLAHGLRAGAAGAGGSRAWHTTRMTLTVAQCAGAAALVVLSMLLARSFVKLTANDLGWEPDGVISVTLSPPLLTPGRDRPWFRYVEWSDRLVARLEATPGFERAAIATQVPLAPQSYPSTIARGRGKASADPARWPAFRHNVTDGYFATMRMRLLEGRTFNRGDRFTAPQVNVLERVERGVVVVSESTARTLWPGQPALGQALWLADGDSSVSWREVIGVVADITFQSVGETPGLHIFVPWTQFALGNPKLLVKTRGDAAGQIPLIRSIIAEVERDTRISGIAPLDTLFARATAQPRFTTGLVGAFGSLALVLAAAGIYGTLSYLVTARRREIGIRLALGARPSAIRSTVLRRGVVPALGGALVGLGAAIAIARLFRALLYDVEPLDPISIAGSAAVLASVAIAAALVPAQRAARVDPTIALRSE